MMRLVGSDQWESVRDRAEGNVATIDEPQPQEAAEVASSRFSAQGDAIRFGGWREPRWLSFEERED